MAATGFTPISLYYSTTASAVPTAGNLVAGELALNTTDEKLYFKNAAGTVKLLASNATSAPVVSFSAGTTGFTPSTATTGAVTLAGTLATTNGGTGLTSFTSGGVVYASSTSALATGSALTFNGTLLTVASSTPKIILSDSGLANDFGIDFYFPSVASSYGQVTLNGSTGGMRFVAGKSGSSGYYQAFELNGSEGMRLTSTGLGIGTSSPGDKLTVAGNIGLANNGTSLQWTSAGNNVAINAASGVLDFYTGTSAYNKRMTLNAAGYLAVGLTPSSWGGATGNKAIEVGFSGSALWANAANNTIVTSNAYFNGTSWIYGATGTASIYQQDTGKHIWYNAASGTAGNAITLTQVLEINATGAIGVGSSPSYGTSGQVLTSAGSGATPTWQTVSALPSQTGNSGKYLTTDGTNASWATVSGGATKGQAIAFSLVFGF
jgi:hypothetical protein